MTKLSNIKKQVVAMMLVASAASIAVAQSYYYDDDIYYDASKKKTEQKTVSAKQKTSNSAYIVNGKNAVTDYPSADTYTVPANGSLDIDVDAYNRRGQFLVSDSIVSDVNGGTDFSYTQRIERFHNPDIVSGSDDEELKEVYTYAMSQPQNINIYVIDNDPWNYYGPSWSWRYGNPWYWNSWYSPYYSWGWNSWGWDPYWSWSWGSAWGPSWGWGPAYGPGWGPSWGPSWGWAPVQAWRPSTPSGSSRPHNYVGSGSMATHRPGSYSSGSMPSSASRPGNMGRGRYSSASSVNASSRPGNYTPAANGSHNNSNVNTSRPGNQGRGREMMNSNSNNNSNNNYNRNSYNNSNNYRSTQSSGSFRSSGGGFSRGSSGSHGSAGGGGSRGRR